MIKPIIFLSTLFIFSICLGCSNDAPKNNNLKPDRVVKKATPSVETKKNKKEKPLGKPSKPTPKEHIDKAKEIIASIAEADVLAIDGKAKYKMLCTTCHGFSGDLNVNGAKDLTASTISLEESVAQIYHGKGLMTPFRGLMKDAEIVAVATYIETLRK